MNSQGCWNQKTASGSATTSSSPADVWPVVTAIGGENRYYALDWLWTVRGWIDAAPLSAAEAFDGLTVNLGKIERPSELVLNYGLYLIWRKPWMSVNADTFLHALLAEAGPSARVIASASMAESCFAAPVRASATQS